MLSAFRPAQLSDLLTGPYDMVIDARSPAEYAEDHIPGAVNLPVLSNEERAQVGTIYKQVSPFDARKIGAAMIARNVAGHIQTHLGDLDGAFQPLIYCWRGGQRSGAFATILSQIGWRVGVLDGGYKAYRRTVIHALDHIPAACPLILIDGNTGTAKTALLAQLRDQGAQVIDLEALAGHRGSLFGGLETPQPGQKQFESRLAQGLTSLRPGKPVFLEAESSKIGQRAIPQQLWQRMKAAPRIQVSAPVNARADHLIRTYSDICASPARMKEMIQKLRPYHPKDTIDTWLEWTDEGATLPLAAALMRDHYDPRYTRSRTQAGGVTLFDLPLTDLSPESLSQAASQILTRLNDPNLANTIATTDTDTPK